MQWCGHGCPRRPLLAMADSSGWHCRAGQAMTARRRPYIRACRHFRLAAQARRCCSGREAECALGWDVHRMWEACRSRFFEPVAGLLAVAAHGAERWLHGTARRLMAVWMVALAVSRVIPAGEGLLAAARSRSRMAQWPSRYRWHGDHRGNGRDAFSGRAQSRVSRPHARVDRGDRGDVGWRRAHAHR